MLISKQICWLKKFYLNKYILICVEQIDLATSVYRHQRQLVLLDHKHCLKIVLIPTKN